MFFYFVNHPKNFQYRALFKLKQLLKQQHPPEVVVG
jgi:hypothetical protein